MTLVAVRSPARPSEVALAITGRRFVSCSLTSGQSIRREDVAGPSDLSQGLAQRQKPGREVHSLSSTDILVMPDRVIPETRSRRAHFGGLGR